MNKILKTTLLTFIAVLGIGFLLVSPVSADVQPLIVQFQHSPSLFQDADLKPGDIVQGWIKVTNNSGSTQKIDIQAINFHSPIHNDDLSRALSIVIKQGSTDLYGGTSAGGAKLLYDFYNDGETYLSDLANGATVQYDITISFPFDTGNDWQTTTTGFDIKIGFQVAGNNDNGGETGGGGTVTSETTGGGSGGGAGPSEPSIVEGSIQASGCSSVEVNIHWLSTYFSTSQVVYSSQYEPHNFDLNAPNYGYSHATNENLTMVTGHDVKIYGFTAGTTYYYRTISRASLSSISLEHSFVDQQDCQTSGPQQTPPIITPYSTSGGSNPGVLPPLGGLPPTNPPAGGNTGGLVFNNLPGGTYGSSGSIQTPETGEENNVPETNENPPFNFLTGALFPFFKLLGNPCFWPILILILMLLYFIISKYFAKDPFYWPIIIVVLLIIFFATYRSWVGKYCSAWYCCLWPLLIAILLFVYIIMRKRKYKEKL